MLRFFGTFARFGEIVRIQVEYRTSRVTQGYVLIRMYGPGLIVDNIVTQSTVHNDIERKQSIV